jgi:NTP pyrophosphatase (non-canonical NTP hydrolase)
VVREYVGTGPLAELVAELDAEEHCRRQEEQARWKEEREHLDALAAPLEELCEVAEVIARAALIASGYHRHNRGEWRKKRHGQRG